MLTQFACVFVCMQDTLAQELPGAGIHDFFGY